MPAITISAVDTATEELTATAHGMLTGQRFRLRNVGGALPAATPALAAVTDYFAIRTTADKFKVAVSSSDAFAGTAVNLTGSGSGTTTLEYGLPYAIPTALAAAGTQIKSENDNAAWSSLVQLYDLLTGQAQSVWSTIVVAVTVTFNALVTFAAGATAAINQHFTVSGTGAYKHGVDTLVIPAADAISPSIAGAFWAYNSAGDNWLSGAASNLLDFPLRLPVGRRILSVTFWYQRGSGTLSFDCFTSALATGSRTNAITQVTVNSGTAIASVTLTAGGGGHVITSAEQLFAMCTSGSATDRCYAVVVTYDYP